MKGAGRAGGGTAAGTRLVVTTLVVVAVLLASGVLLAWQNLRGEQQRVVSEAALTTQAAASEGERFLRDRIDLLQVMASDEAFRSGDVARISARLAEMDAAQGALQNLGWADRNCFRQASISLGARPVDVSDRDWCLRPLQTGQPYVAEATVARNISPPSVGVVIGVPTYDASGAINGVLGGGQPVERLEAALVPISAPGGGDLLVVDRAGQLIVDGQPGAEVVDVSGAPVLAAARANETGTIERGAGLRGARERLVAYAAVPIGGWIIFVDRPAALAYGAAEQTFRQILALLLLLALCSLALMIWAARRLSAATRALRLSEERHRTVSELSTDYAYGLLLRQDGRAEREWISGAYERLTGYTGDELDALGWAGLVAPADRPSVAARIAALCAGQEDVREWRVLRRDGAVRWLRDQARPLEQVDAAGTRRVVAAAEDITVERTAGDRLRLLTDVSAALGASLDARAALPAIVGRCVGPVGEWCRLDLWDETAGTLRLAAAVPAAEPPAAHAARWPALVAEAARTAVVQAAHSDEASQQAFDAETLAAEPRPALLCVPLSAGRGLLGVMSFASDGVGFGADDRTLAELVARRVAQGLENARLYGAEHRAREVAEAAASARDQFLSIAAHELRTPVTAVKGNAQMALRQLTRGGMDRARLERVLETVNQSCDRLALLINDLLDVSRLQSGQLQVRLAPCDLLDLVADFVERNREALGATHRLVLERPPAAPSPRVAADPERLRQVLDNLLSNAVKYSPAGGTIRLTVRESAENVTIAITDEGIGLPAGTLESIFQPFGRAANATAASLPGMGLGLYICRQIVEAHGGRLWAESAGEGRGATLLVELPVQAGPAAANGQAGAHVEVSDRAPA